MRSILNKKIFLGSFFPKNTPTSGHKKADHANDRLFEIHFESD
tara:strand:- start:242 stop:370 length:129 start_codon:yes stop_codon:yes gene_type:complete